MHWIGLMSGTSLDGLDLVYVEFKNSTNNDADQLRNDQYSFSISACETMSYSSDWSQRLQNSNKCSASELIQLDKEYGALLAEMVNEFITKNNIDRAKISGVASHGHTVFHQPEKGFTLQIGCGQTLAYHTKLTVVNDFRTKDIIAGGQGAPLVPIGERYLFEDTYDAFLNLGGFCNIGFFSKESHKAYDISPCNLPLNYLSTKIGLAFDSGGKIAASGKVDQALLEQLNQLPFYRLNGPKSLGTEWLNAEFYQLLPEKIAQNEIPDLLRTLTEHIAIQIAHTSNQHQLNKIMVTGGGAYNTFLLERIRSLTNSVLELPSKELIDFKEALIFSFLGYRRINGLSTTLASVTGAKSDQITGVIHT